MTAVEGTVTVPLAAHLKKHGVPSEIVEDISKAGYEGALVWANAVKEEDLAVYFLRPGSAFGPSEDKGSPADRAGMRR